MSSLTEKRKIEAEAAKKKAKKKTNGKHLGTKNLHSRTNSNRVRLLLLANEN